MFSYSTIILISPLKNCNVKYLLGWKLSLRRFLLFSASHWKSSAQGIYQSKENILFHQNVGLAFFHIDIDIEEQWPSTTASFLCLRLRFLHYVIYHPEVKLISSARKCFGVFIFELVCFSGHCSVESRRHTLFLMKIYTLWLIFWTWFWWSKSKQIQDDQRAQHIFW